MQARAGRVSEFFQRTAFDDIFPHEKRNDVTNPEKSLPLPPQLSSSQRHPPTPRSTILIRIIYPSFYHPHPHHHPALTQPKPQNRLPIMSAPYKPTAEEASTSSSSSYLSSSSPSRQPSSTSSDPSQPQDFITVMSHKTPSKYTDPCAHAAKLSMKCLDDHAYDRSKCGEVFNQYRECKKAWINQRRQDRLNNRPGAFD